jgi:hypothetical protein
VIDVLRADWRHQQLRFVSGAVLSNNPGRVRNMRGTASARRQVKFEELESTSSEAGVNRRSSALCHHDGHTYSVGWSAVLSPLG